MSLEEKRKYSRVRESVSFQVGSWGSAMVSTTQDLSCGGALCLLPREIPAMTRLKVTLELPAKGSSDASSIRCEGVVIRQEKQGSDYRTAIFFSTIDAEDRRRIAEYILQSMFGQDR